MSRTRLPLPALAALLLLALLPATASAAPAPEAVFGGKVPCAPREGVLVCEGSADNRVPTFDGVPLDVTVAMPAGELAPRPLVVLLHGYGGSKDGFASVSKWARRGYAVLTYTARGFNESCGRPQFRDDPVCLQRGWIRLADTRFEVRDTQHFAGVLADEGIADPQRIGPTGPSYAAGQSLALALLKDRVMDADGTLKPWTSPKGTPMRIAAAAPWIPWSDLVYSLVPNGRTLDYLVQDHTASLDPPGVMKLSYVSGLFASGEASGQYAPPRVDPDADLRTWYSRVSSGEPYTDPLAMEIFDEISSHHEAMSLPIPQGGAAPLFISNGFTDDLFPVDEGLRIVNRLRALSPTTPIRQLYMDYGHARGQNKKADTDRLELRIEQWFDHYLKGEGTAPAQEVEALTQTCPTETPSGGPFTAPTWGDLHPGELRLESPDGGTLTSGGGDETVGRTIDPIAGAGACATTADEDAPGSVTFRFPAAGAGGYTVLGSPTVLADLAVTGENAQIASRLWDVSPEGRQTLIARGLYRPEPSGRQVFQLHPGAFEVAEGHLLKLELLGRDQPYGRASNGAFEVAVTNADVRIPLAEKPGAAGGQVAGPSAAPLPPGGQVAPASMPEGAPPPEPLTPSPRSRPGRVKLRVRYLERSRGRCGGVRLLVFGPGTRGARRIDVRGRGRRLARDRKRPYTVRLGGRKLKRVKRLSVRVVARDGAARTVRRKLRRCR